MRFHQICQRLKEIIFSKAKDDVTFCHPVWLKEVLLSANIKEKVIDRILLSLDSSERGKKPWKDVVREELFQIASLCPFNFSKKFPQIFFFLGENGHGKTTSCAKVAHYFLQEGKRVFLVASDTFRAAAGQQLQFWADALEISCLQGTSKSDPASVVFQGIQKALLEKNDVILIDTSGRLSNNQNLMMELKKSILVAHKFLKKDLINSLLVLDSSLGQYALTQALHFSQHLEISGYLFTRAETPSGTLFSVLEGLPLPVAFLGTGREIGDLSLFKPDIFIDSFLKILKKT